MSEISSTFGPASRQLKERLIAAFLAIGLGLGILFVVGFVPVEAIHNTAHDGRHVFSFPCH